MQFFVNWLDARELKPTKIYSAHSTTPAIWNECARKKTGNL
jgi:hypothetical protein